MNRRFRWIVCTVFLALVMCLSACSKERGASKAAKAPAKQAVAHTRVAVTITSYGPDKAVAGQPFNKQPSGNSAVWVRVNRSLDGSKAAIYFNGTRLHSSISGNLITAGVPANLYAKPGTYMLHIAGMQGSANLRSNDVKVVVQ